MFILRIGKLVIDKNVSNYAYKNMKGVKEIVISKPNIIIGREAFANCNNLTKITLNDDIKIEKYAFSNCNNLEKVRFYDSHLEDYAFANCEKLKDIHFVGNYKGYFDKIFSNTPYKNKINTFKNKLNEEYTIFTYLMFIEMFCPLIWIPVLIHYPKVFDKINQEIKRIKR